MTGENATSARGGSRHGSCLPRKHRLPTLIELRSIDGLAQMSGVRNLYCFLSTYLLAICNPPPGGFDNVFRTMTTAHSSPPILHLQQRKKEIQRIYSPTSSACNKEKKKTADSRQQATPFVSLPFQSIIVACRCGSAGLPVDTVCEDKTLGA